MWTTPRQLTSAPPPIEESCPLAGYTPLTGYEPNLLDNLHYSETTEIIFRHESSDDETNGKALSSPLFILERGESADRRKAYHSYEESLLPAQSFFTHTQERGDPYTNIVRAKNENQVAKWKTKESGFSFKDKRSKFSLTLEPRFRNTNPKSQRREIFHTTAGDEQHRRDQLLLHEQLSEQNRDLPKAHIKSLNEIEELKRFQGSRFDEFSSIRLIENPKSSSILRESSNILKPIRCVQFTKAVLRHAHIRDTKSIAWNDLPRWSSSA